MNSEKWLGVMLKFIIIVCVLLLVSSVSLHYLHNNYVSRSRYDNLSKRYINLQHISQDKYDNLNKRYTDLQQDYNAVLSDYNKLAISEYNSMLGSGSKKQIDNSTKSGTNYKSVCYFELDNSIKGGTSYKSDCHLKLDNSIKGGINYKNVCHLESDYSPRQYINPKHPKIVELAHQLKGKDFHEDIRNTEQWVLNHINTDRIYYSDRTIDQVLADGRGDCSEISMMFVSIMRAMGYNETYVVIATTDDKELSTLYSSSAHAYSIVLYNNKTYTFYDIPEYNHLLYMYNDKKVFRCQ